MKHIFTLITIFTFSFVDAQIELTVEVTGTPSSVRMTGPFWGWDPSGGPEAVNNGDNTWTVTMNAPTVNMEYLWVVDSVQEALVADAAGGNCADAIDSGNLITDYNGWANRVWKLENSDIQTAYGNCSSLTLSTSVDVIDLVTLYPNPTSDFVRISAGESIDFVRVFDVTGRVVKESSPNKSDFSLNVSNLSKGIYLVKLNAGNKETTTKLIK
jgi:hypothetical protein